MARDAGARKVYLASAAPPVRYPNIYGIDMPSAEDLVANGRSETEIEQIIGCDWLLYKDLPDLEAAVAAPTVHGLRSDSTCIRGDYGPGIAPGDSALLHNQRQAHAQRK